MRSVYFSEQELRCPCCGKNEMQAEFLSELDNLRVAVGGPITLNSAFRCPSHNAAVGGKPNSAHVRGLAADVRATDGRTRYKVLRAAYQVGFKRIGLANTFVHVDTDDFLPQEVAWTY